MAIEKKSHSLKCELIGVIDRAVENMDSRGLPSALAGIGIKGKDAFGISLMVKRFLDEYVSKNETALCFWPDMAVHICNCFETGKYDFTGDVCLTFRQETFM